nr:DUF805 domain-containing protein [Enterococcus sp. 665A]MBO1342942.1 DUF805 domain-containing protein [Enterococcus sp. 665A]
MKVINQVPGEVGFKQAIKDFFVGYVEFKGRTTRAGYWWVQLILMSIRLLFGLILFTTLFSAIINTGMMYGYYDYYMSDDEIAWEVFSALFRILPILIFYFVYSLAILLPNLSLMTRRMRDAGLRGRGLLVHYIALFLLGMFQFTFQVASTWSPGYYVASMLCLFLNLIISIELFVFTLMPTDEITVRSNSSFLRFFFREKELPTVQTSTEILPQETSEKPVEEIIEELKKEPAVSSSNETKNEPPL